MEPQVGAAMIAAFATVGGWIVSHELTSHRNEAQRRVAAQLAFLERQLEELYGPLLGLVLEGRKTYQDLLDVLGRGYVFLTGKELPDSELKTWLFWVEADFLPRNNQIKMLLTTKAHLIEGPTLPGSYIVFLDHANSWAVNHRRWKEQGISYSWHSKINWPIEFENEVESMFSYLKGRQAMLLGKLRR